ncbi:hypothetical protein [Rheinheimera sp.]|uniref:hypothetical protein n=1 Tax=Rheinheimera sp. TaxID=1869214 RepID=UPI00307FC6ED
MKYFLVLCFMVFCAAAQSDHADGISNKVLNEYFKDELNYEAYFSKFKTALLAGDKQLVASLNLYPLRVNYPSGPVYYATKEQFIENYDKVITAELLNRVKGQQFKNLFYNYQGLHIGFGDIWFGAICLDGEQCKKVEIYAWAYNVMSISKK